jgi:hypothetical protein
MRTSRQVHRFIICLHPFWQSHPWQGRRTA